MQTPKIVLTLALVAGIAVGIRSVATASPVGPENLSAVDGSRTPDRLRDLLDRYDAKPDQGLLPEIDAAAGQRDAVYSRLFWYTDLDAAKVAAKAQNKPILYLRMLGKLTDEYSCANSRFFRTVLYSNQRISSILRDQFILVWVSERPVPVATIDFGNGRVLKRTITGNSAHYVLDASGRVVDVLPGLLDPVTFEQIVTKAGIAATRGDTRHTSAAATELRQGWLEASRLLSPSESVPLEVFTDAESAGERALGKGVVELPMVRSLSPEPASKGTPSGRHALQTALNQTNNTPAKVAAPNAVKAGGRAEGKRLAEVRIVREIVPANDISGADGTFWDNLASTRLADASLDAASITLMRSQYASMDQASFDRMVARFQKVLAVDSVRNNFWFRSQALAWLQQDPKISVEALNARVYSELFLTPATDPWLGLVGDDVYAAVTGGGCTSAACR